MITNRRLSGIQRRKLAQQIRQLESRISNPNPLFHIDLLIRERYRLRTLPRIIFTYEMKENALTLYGPDVHQRIPEVTAENLDYSNTHEILYKRLGAIIFHLPRRWIQGTASVSELRVAGYLLCRNALDLTTVFLPAEGILLPSYQARVAHV